MLAMANKNGKVFGSIPGLANRARVSIEVTEEALRKFMGPDPYSRTKDFDGRRIEEIDGGWRLLTYEKHAAYRHEDERRQYMRELMRKRRSVSSPLANVSNVSHGKPPLAHADADADADVDKESTKSKSGLRPTFKPPSLDEVRAYCQERGGKVNPEQWYDHYSSVGWYAGRHKMRDWQAAVRKWEHSNYGAPFQGGYQKSKAKLKQEERDAERARVERIWREMDDADGVQGQLGKEPGTH